MLSNALSKLEEKLPQTLRKIMLGTTTNHQFWMDGSIPQDYLDDANQQLQSASNSPYP